MIKLAILSRYQSTTSRGAETFVTELTNSLPKEDFQIEILSGSSADSVSKLISGRFDLVIPINGRMQAIKASILRLFGRYKLVTIGESGPGRDLIINLLVKPDVFVALSDSMVSYAKRWNILGSKIVKIPNGVDTDKFSPSGEEVRVDLPRPIILSVGALEWYKYHDRTIKALAKLSQGSLLIVGKGTQEKELTDLARNLIPGRFQITSFPFEALPKVYRSADLFTLPSWDREAFGIVYIEALASNLPVVAPNDLLRGEIVGDAGILANVSDSDEFASALDKALKSSWGDLPRKQSMNFSWKEVGNLYAKLFKGMVTS